MQNMILLHCLTIIIDKRRYFVIVMILFNGYKQQMKALPLLVVLLLLTGASVGYYEEGEHDCLCGMEREGPSISSVFGVLNYKQILKQILKLCLPPLMYFMDYP